MGIHRQCVFALVGACIALICMPACTQAGREGVDGEQEAQVERAVRRIIAADMAGDLDAVVSVYTDDAILLSPGVPDIAGIDAIRNHYERLFAETELLIENETHETIVSGNLAITRGVNHVAATSKRGGTTTSGSDKYVMILKKDAAASWRISHLIWAPQAE